MQQRRRAVAITALGLAICLAAAVLAPDPKLFEPLTLLLAATAVIAAMAYVDVQGTLLTDSSFVPFMLAAAFLGPTAVFGIATFTELAAWLMYRYRREALLVNLLATGGPLLIVSALLSLVNDRDGPAFYAALAGTGALELVLNALCVVWLIGLLDGRSLVESVRGWREIVAPFLFSLLLAVAAASVYTNLGALAVVVILAIVIAFRYLVAQVFSARRRATEIAVLAASRGTLVAQTLDAEDREKRRLSEAIHDGPLQQLVAASQDLAEATNGIPEGLSRAEGAVATAVDQLRHIVFELHPAVLSQGGLLEAVRAIARHEATRGSFQAVVDIDEEVMGISDRLVFATVRELLINVARHSAATEARVEVRREAQAIAVSVEDNGRGMTEETRSRALQAGHLGLAAIQERIEAVGGRMSVISDAGHGSKVVGILPVGAATPPHASTSTSVGEDEQDG
jgi:signal transduction histidine kinase